MVPAVSANPGDTMVAGINDLKPRFQALLGPLTPG